MLAVSVSWIGPGTKSIRVPSVRPLSRLPDDDSLRAPVPFLLGRFAVRPASDLPECPVDVRGEVSG